VVISGASYTQFQKQFIPFLPSRIDIMKENLILMPTTGSQCYEYDAESNQWKMTDGEFFPANVKNKALVALKEIVESNQYEIPSRQWGERIEDRETQVTLSALGQEAPIIEKRVWDPDRKKRQKIKEKLEACLPEVTILIGETTSIDIVPKGFNKAVGLKRLIKRLNYQQDDLIFVSNGIFPGSNDYSVFEAGFETVRVVGPQETATIIKNWLL
jgi:hypothetical protein